MNKTVTQKLNKAEAKELYSKLTDLGWKEEVSNNQYVDWRLVSEIGNVMMYSSGKVVLQGSEGIELLLSPAQEDTSFEPHIGVDEVGKGDYFGPMVVASCFVSKKAHSKLRGLRIMDSKKISDGKIVKLAPQIEELCEFEYKVFHPSEYNDLVDETGNVAIVLAKGHSYVIENLLKKLQSKSIECKLVVIDQFSKSKNRVVNELGKLGKHAKLEQFHKGESDIAVACASVLARARFLKEWERMEGEYGMKFNKGASDVIENGKEFVHKHGEDELRKVAKVGFKTTSKIFSLF
jgi:ribonuclease HIII